MAAKAASSSHKNFLITVDPSDFLPQRWFALIAIRIKTRFFTSITGLSHAHDFEIWQTVWTDRPRTQLKKPPQKWSCDPDAATTRSRFVSIFWDSNTWPVSWKFKPRCDKSIWNSCCCWRFQLFMRKRMASAPLLVKVNVALSYLAAGRNLHLGFNIWKSRGLWRALPWPWQLQLLLHCAHIEIYPSSSIISNLTVLTLGT